MLISRRAFLLLFVSILSGSAGCPAQEVTSTVAITNVSVIPMDVEHILNDQTVLISNGRIEAIGSTGSVSIPANALLIDGDRRFLIPGLSDMHAHVSREEGRTEQDYIRQGVTVVRNMQGEPAHLQYRNKNQGVGPVFRTAGPALAGYRISNRHRIVTEVDDARAAVREQTAAGYDYIKVYSFLTVEVYDAILDEARELGIPVVGHVPDDVKATRAISAGQSTIEHLFGYFWELESESSSLQGQWDPRRLFHAVEIDESKIPSISDMTAQAGVWNCPTLWRKDNYLTSPLAREAWETPGLRELGHANRMKLVKGLHDAGAGLLVGTDDRAEVVHDELALFVEAGLTPFEALYAATVNAAIYLEMVDEMGTVSEGKRANLVLLDANPLDDISNTKAIAGVILDGRWEQISDEKK